MSISHRFRRWLFGAIVVLALPLIFPTSAGASTVIYSETLAPCSLTEDLYVVDMRLPALPGTIADYPSSILLHFGNGSIVEVAAFGQPSALGLRYMLDDSAQVYQQHDLEGASAVVDIPPGSDDYVFQVTALPCTVNAPSTATVSGVAVQHGSGKPVAGLMVCLQELQDCDETDEAGRYELTSVPFGSYTLVSDGPKFRPFSTSITVGEGGVVIDIVQRRGGGQ